MLKQCFRQYPTEVRGVSERMVGHYPTSPRAVERNLRQAGKLEKSVFDLESLSELPALREFLKTLPEIVSQGETGNRMYAAG